MAFGPPFKARVSLMLFSFTPFPGECIRGWKSTKSASADSLLRLSPLPQRGRGVGGEGAFAGVVSTAKMKGGLASPFEVRKESHGGKSSSEDRADRPGGELSAGESGAPGTVRRRSHRRREGRRRSDRVDTRGRRPDRRLVSRDRRGHPAVAPLQGHHPPGHRLR